MRLGVFWLWMGVESKREIYAKNKDIDLNSLTDVRLYVYYTDFTEL